MALVIISGMHLIGIIVPTLAHRAYSVVVITNHNVVGLDIMLLVARGQVTASPFPSFTVVLGQLVGVANSTNIEVQL